MSAPFAAGRTADVFADGPGRVRRVYRDGRDATAEATLMRHLLAHDYPVPVVHDVDGPTLVLERVDGPTLADDALDHPDRLAAAARTMRELLDRLADVPPPTGLTAPFGAGKCLLHLDFQPFNVLLGPHGPVVIDWSNAASGPAPADRAYSWVLMRTSVVPVPDREPDTITRAQQVFAAALLDGDGDPARAWVPEAARYRLRDPNVLPAERPLLLGLAHPTEG